MWCQRKIEYPQMPTQGIQSSQLSLATIAKAEVRFLSHPALPEQAGCECAGCGLAPSANQTI